MDDELQNIMGEIIRNGYENRVCIALDYFDASINRLAAWVIGMRNAQKAILKAYLEPTALLRKVEADGDFTSRLALQEEVRVLPLEPIWNMYCAKQNVQVGDEWLKTVKKYEADVMSKR